MYKITFKEKANASLSLKFRSIWLYSLVSRVFQSPTSDFSITFCKYHKSFNKLFLYRVFLYPALTVIGNFYIKKIAKRSIFFPIDRTGDQDGSTLQVDLFSKH